MLFTNLVALISITSGFAVANPVPVPVVNAIAGPELEARQIRGWQCGNTRHTLVSVENAMGDGIRLRRALRTIAQGNGVVWPHEYRNGSPNRPEVDPSPCARLNLYEFPILASGADYAGGNPGPDRVVFADSNRTPGAFEQCFLMTHTGATGNLFVKCRTFS
ncbi:Ribonuclease/ribotoxin [Podospora aff. communis PSN243]|uniref:Ribonuclease/ribotoxin n=1 Tax=Podospora aff. communis PSN243 TaxID=3040156 RepID=A0AAV9H6Y0_9PEZI|nr:Ribonuclease/ribotoxin [Podospora aff. communis PSN243]